MSHSVWIPDNRYKIESPLWRYKVYIENKYNIVFADYQELHAWSVSNLSIFWNTIFQYFDISSVGTCSTICDWNVEDDDFTNVNWFKGISLSYAQHIFKQSNSSRPAIKYTDEQGNYNEVSWHELENKVSNIQQYLIAIGIEKGDRVVGILNNTVDTIAIFLAVNSLGAIWSCCSPDFGNKSIIDRFEQIAPKILFIENSYQYNNKQFYKSETASLLMDYVDSIIDTIAIGSAKWEFIFTNFEPQPLTFENVEFSHPIWILYSSGTTGIPKAITHSTGGNLLEHYKALALHQNVQEGDNFLWYTTTGWMMWNYALSSLLCGATLCLYNGFINHDHHQTFWHFLKKAKVDHLGAGAVYYDSLKNIVVTDYYPKVIGSTGSPLAKNTFDSLQSIFPNTHIISLSGGTDVCSAFLTGCTLLPVYAGQLQCKALGADIVAMDEDGYVVLDQVGELVIRKPMPTMPLYFWNDKHNNKYKESYFEKYDHLWAHGDWIKISSDKGIIIYGRSDATLNRDGIRIGTAEIYNTVNSISTIVDSLVITVDNEQGTSPMILFVQLLKNEILNTDLLAAINVKLRSENSPRHVPDFIYQVQDIPYTLSGKKLELPIKKLFSGISLDKIVSKDIMRNPACLEEYHKIKSE